MPYVKYVGSDLFLKRRPTVEMYGITFKLGKTMKVDDPNIVRKLMLQNGAFEETRGPGRPKRQPETEESQDVEDVSGSGDEGVTDASEGRSWTGPER